MKMKRTEADYNPQIGERRSLFSREHDFLQDLSGYYVEDSRLVLKVQTWQKKTASVVLSFLSDTILRIRMIPGEWTTDSRSGVLALKDEFGAELSEEEEFITFGMPRLKVQIRKAYYELIFLLDGKVLTKEQIFDTNVDNRWKVLPPGFDFDEKGSPVRARETMYLWSDEEFWGFGEKFTEFNKRGRKLHIWQKDALSTNTEDSYKGHPFFISSRGFGIFLNTYTRSSFDMGLASGVSWQMEAEDGSLDYLLIAEEGKEDYQSVIRQYTELIGEMPMIPKWAFGFWMSKCSYRNRAEIEETIEKAQINGIPIDVIHIDGWQKKELTGTWVWDEERFPDPKGMIQWLNDRKVHLSLWIYPYLEETSPIFQTLAEKGYFITDDHGKPALFYAMADAKYRSGCFDFTNPEFLAWYKPRVKAVLDQGISVIKTDFSEAVPENAHYANGMTGIEGHNMLTLLYAETLYELLKESCTKEGRIPMLWGRSGYTGSQRIPAVWAGDSSTALNNHASILHGGMSLAMSGISFWGFDMGGFYNTDASGNECRPTDEEYLRSMALGFFMPLSRAHGKTPREPWNYSGEVLETIRDYDRLRHALVPYLYSAACETNLFRRPMIRPLVLQYPEDRAAGQDLMYFLGGALLVIPPFDRSEYRVWLPKGKWCHLFTGEILQGGRYVDLKPSVKELPVFQKEDTIVPMLGNEMRDRVPEGKFRQMTVRLFYEHDITTLFYDEAEDGTIQEYYFDAKSGEQGVLFIKTDMDLIDVELRSDRKFTTVYLNGCMMK